MLSVKLGLQVWPFRLHINIFVFVIWISLNALGNSGRTVKLRMTTIGPEKGKCLWESPCGLPYIHIWTETEFNPYLISSLLCSDRIYYFFYSECCTPNLCEWLIQDRELLPSATKDGPEYSNKTLEWCLNECQKTTAFTCHSLDYNKITGTCRLSSSLEMTVKYIIIYIYIHTNYLHPNFTRSLFLLQTNCL